MFARKKQNRDVLLHIRNYNMHYAKVFTCFSVAGTISCNSAEIVTSCGRLHNSMIWLQVAGSTRYLIETYYIVSEEETRHIRNYDKHYARVLLASQ
jgi:hypothetical protein